MKTAAIIGGGVIGGGWAARFLLNGWDVAIHDPAPDAERKIEAVLKNARRSLPSLYNRALPPEGKITYTSSIAEAVAKADWVQESVPERLDIKHSVLAEIEKHISSSDVVVASSTSGFKPSELTEKGARAIVAHPFNPVYLLPLIELVGDTDICTRASDILTSIGMKPLHVKKEIDAHIADRLLEAVWREGLWLIKDEICTTEELDDAIRYGFGLRWAQMGLFETYRIAGGEAGMRHFMAQFGPALKWPWTKLMDVPEFNDELVDMIASQSDAQSGHHTIRDLEQIRDDNLVGIIRSLRVNNQATGAVIADHEAHLDPLDSSSTLPLTVDRTITQSWTDYNGHMNETHYLEVFAQASDEFMRLIGADAAYIEAGKSYFTAETHIRYLGEVHAHERVTVRTHMLMGTGKKLHLFHEMRNAAEEVVATGEHLLLHVDLTTRRTCPAEPQLEAAMVELQERQSAVERPEGIVLQVG